MKNFHFPQIFTPIVGQISFDNYQCEKQHRKTLMFDKRLQTQRDIQISDDEKGSGKTTRTLKFLTTSKSIKQMGLIADSMNLISRKDVSINNTKQKLQQLAAYNKKLLQNSIFSKNSKDHKQQRKMMVKFHNNNDLLMQESSYSINTVGDQNNSLDNTNRNTIAQLSNKDQKMQFKRENVKKRLNTENHQSEQYGNNSQNIRIKRKIHLNSNNKKVLGKKNQNINIKAPKKGTKNTEEKQRSPLKKGNPVKLIQNKIKKNEEQSTNKQQDNNKELTSIKTVDIDKNLSDRNEGNSLCSFKNLQTKTTRNLSGEKNQENRKYIQKTYLKRLNTFHVLNFEDRVIDFDEDKSSLFNQNKSRKKSGKSESPELFHQQSEQTEQNMKISRKGRHTQKKVTFFNYKQNDSEKQNQIFIERRANKKKCLLKLKNRTSIEVGTLLESQTQVIPKNFKTFARNSQRYRRKSKKNTSGLTGLDTNVYNELNSFFNRIMKLKCRQDEEQIGNLKSPQPIYMTSGNGLTLKDQDRIKQIKKQHQMIDFGVRLSKGYQLKQTAV